VKKKRQNGIAIVKAQLRELTLQWTAVVVGKKKKLNTILGVCVWRPK